MADTEKKFAAQYEFGKGNFIHWYSGDPKDPKSLRGYSDLYVVDKVGSSTSPVTVSTGDSCSIARNGQIISYFNSNSEHASVSLGSDRQIIFLNGRINVEDRRVGRALYTVDEEPSAKVNRWNPLNWLFGAVSREIEEEQRGANSPAHLQKVAEAFKNTGITCTDAKGTELTAPLFLKPNDIFSLSRQAMGKFQNELPQR